LSKVTIIGAGSVGATIAYSLATKLIASEIVLIDINKDKAVGEAVDISQGLPFCGPVKVHQGEYEDAIGSEIVVITSGIPRKAGQSRLDLTKVNVEVLKDIIPRITKSAPSAIYIMVSNPVDVLTYVFNKYSEIPEERIIGTGTLLDTARLQTGLAEQLAINPENIHAYVFGEHGDTSFVPWSIANLSGVSLDNYKNSLSQNHKENITFDKVAIEEYVKTSGGYIIQRKGATFYGIAMSVAHICKCILRSIDTIMPVSSMLHGEYGVEDVCLSILSTVGRSGISSKVLAPLNEDEVAKLHVSADSLKEVIKSLGI
jgi:L-lactate dehydrogenase